MRDPGPNTEIGRLKRRADFLHVGKGARWHAAALTLQSAARDDDAPAQPRLGFTLTRKVGCAVVRNRARRRLKEAVRLSSALPLKRNHDYVIVGRIAALRLSFEDLKRELHDAVETVHTSGRSGSRTKRTKNAGAKMTRRDP